MTVLRRTSLAAGLAELQVPLTLIAGIGVLTVLAALLGGEQLQVTVTEMLIRVIVVVGIYIFVGNSGIISFGHIGLMAIGAYVAAWAECDPDWKDMALPGLPDFLRTQQYSFPVGLAGAMGLVTVVALVFGAPILRLSGLAASIATFAFLAFIYNVCANWDSVTGAMTSLVGIPTVIGPGWAFLGATVSIVVAYGFQRSGAGLMLRASREDPVAASAVAVNVFGVRLLAFLLSALIVGAGGYFYANFLGVVAVESFYIDLTFLTLTMLVVGGMRSLTGAVLGVVGITIISEFLHFGESGVDIGGSSWSLPKGTQEIALGIIMALILILRPRGITDGKELHLSWHMPQLRLLATRKERGFVGRGRGAS
jgi:branched-chain amino acid transport system permease protein